MYIHYEAFIAIVRKIENSDYNRAAKRQKMLNALPYDKTENYDKYLLFYDYLPIKSTKSFANKYTLYNVQHDINYIKRMICYSDSYLAEKAKLACVNLNIIKLLEYEKILKECSVEKLSIYISEKSPLFEIGYCYVLRWTYKNRLQMLKMLYENGCPLTLCNVLDVLNTRNKEIIEYMFSIGVNDATIADIYAMKCQNLGLNLDGLPLSPYAILYGYDKMQFEVDKQTFINIMNVITYNEKTFSLIQIVGDDNTITLDDIPDADFNVKLALYRNGRLNCAFYQLLNPF